MFFIPFLIFFFVLAIPLFTLDSTLGQMFRNGPVEIFASIRQKFGGIGWASVLVSWMISLYYAIILCWGVYYFFLSFLNPLPWSKEAALEKAKMNNATISDSLSDSRGYMNIHFFKEEVLKISGGIADMGSLDNELVFCLLITYVMIFFCIAKGIQSSSKVVYVTGPAPIVLLFILLIK